MRLIGGKDYYDSVQALGFDDSIVLVRSAEVLRYRDAKIPGFIGATIQFYFNRKNDRDKRLFSRGYFSGGKYRDKIANKSASIETVNVVVANKVYAGICVDILGEPMEYLWTPQHVEKFCERYDCTYGIGMLYSWRKPDPNVSSLEHCLTAQEINKTLYNHMLDNGISIILHRNDNVEINSALLREVEFFRRLDAYSIYQELEMWVGGILPHPGNPTIEITDNKVKIEKHGFDLKTSFRKPKSSA